VELFNREDLVIREGYGVSAEIAQPPNSLASSTGAASTPQVGSGGAVATQTAALKQEDQLINDPLGQGLGSQRILRVSPLAPVRAVC